MYVFASMHAFICGALKLIVKAFLNYNPSYSLKQSLLGESQFVFMANGVGHLVLGISCLHLLRTGITCVLPCPPSVCDGSGI